MWIKQLSKLLLDEEGQGLVECSLILTLAVIVVISSLFFLGQSFINLYEEIKVEILKL